VNKEKARTLPKDLVDGTLPKPRPTWYEKLSAEHRKYVLDVVSVMLQSPGVSTYRVAEAIKEELSLVTHKNTIVRTLQEMLKVRMEK